MSYEASMYELQQFRKKMEEVEKLPLAERKENAKEWFKDLSDNYMMIAERVGWLCREVMVAVHLAPLAGFLPRPG